MATGSFRATTLPNICGLIGVMPVVVGMMGILSPENGINMSFETPIPSTATPEAKKLHLALMQGYAWRTVTMGLAQIAAWYAGSRRAQGLIMLVGIVPALGDGIVARQLTGRDGIAFKHWAFTPISAGLGAALLGWI